MIDDTPLRPQRCGRQRQVCGSCGQIEYALRATPPHHGERLAAPVNVHAGAQQVIEQVLARGNGVEHALNPPLVLDGYFAILRLTH